MQYHPLHRRPLFPGALPANTDALPEVECNKPVSDPVCWGQPCPRHTPEAYALVAAKHVGPDRKAPTSHRRNVRNFEDEPYDPNSQARCTDFGLPVCSDSTCARHSPNAYTLWSARHRSVSAFSYPAR